MSKHNMHLPPEMKALLDELWQWRKKQPAYMNVRGAGDYGRSLLLRALLEEQREKDDQ